MPARTSIALIKPFAALLAVLLVCAAAFALLRLESWTASPESYRLDLSNQFRVDPQLIHYRQVAEIPLELHEPHAIAVGADDRIYAAGQGSIRIFSPDGQPAEAIPVGGNPTALAVAGTEHPAPGRLYAALANRIEVISPTSQSEAVWDHFGDKALFTSVVAVEDGLLVADAGNRVVLRLDHNGQVVAQISSCAMIPNNPVSSCRVPISTSWPAAMGWCTQSIPERGASKCSPPAGSARRPGGKPAEISRGSSAAATRPIWRSSPTDDW